MINQNRFNYEAVNLKAAIYKFSKNELGKPELNITFEAKDKEAEPVEAPVMKLKDLFVELMRVIKKASVELVEAGIDPAGEPIGFCFEINVVGIDEIKADILMHFDTRTGLQT